MSRPPPLARGTQPIAPVIDHGGIPEVLDLGDVPALDDAPPRGGHLCAGSLARRALPPVDLSAIDEATIASLDRLSLESIVNVCHHLAGLTPLCTFAGITDDELREMATRALARVKAHR